MCVAEDADVGLFSFQKCLPFCVHLPAFVQNVTDGNTATAQSDNPFGRIATASIAIDIAGGGCDRSDLLQLFDHGPTANVPGMQNVIDAFEMSSNRRIE